ncbi:hypothetical protein B0H67DRAFT_582905 [Lasiosphaeris hirsuta]|uniref:Uncharacterized protein n=1 Tax=Lasiosphaeris hirsuta TaxID=260670 RepID=A0AA40AI95_9PEZI|nr:hypothetical protein B0H67DRAFT_582905 [Lasiosphaeris hirsuta]
MLAKNLRTTNEQGAMASDSGTGSSTGTGTAPTLDRGLSNQQGSSERHRSHPKPSENGPNKDETDRTSSIDRLKTGKEETANKTEDKKARYPGGHDRAVQKLSRRYKRRSTRWKKSNKQQHSKIHKLEQTIQDPRGKFGDFPNQNEKKSTQSKWRDLARHSTWRVDSAIDMHQSMNMIKMAIQRAKRADSAPEKEEVTRRMDDYHFLQIKKRGKVHMHSLRLDRGRSGF